MGQRGYLPNHQEYYSIYILQNYSIYQEYYSLYIHKTQTQDQKVWGSILNTGHV